MQRLEVRGAVRLIYRSWGVKGLISGVSYMFRSPWVHPQGDSCISRTVHIDTCKTYRTAYCCLHEDEPTGFETCRRRLSLLTYLLTYFLT